MFLNFKCKIDIILQVKAGKQQGFEINADSNKTLADSLDMAVDKKNPYFNTMLRMIATRCMMQVMLTLKYLGHPWTCL